MKATIITPGETYRILAPASSLHKYLTDSYWCSAMEEVCEGKLDGVAVRYTGQQLVLLQFRPKQLSPAGYRYPISMSIPVEYLVPISTEESTEDHNICKHDTNYGTKESTFLGSGFAPLCVVCGRYNIPGMVLRHHGYKCPECVGHKSTRKLRMEGARRR
ncbi:hypothetical protein, conserved [Trypanosoma brucei gambiense DAL972]|uniref:Uncharacterized protein n=2 Tax=Trypanosoma brucei TaxID=5691 RepID=C9ZMK8_TRYB9|nr:hypothetical protein, conserved [Trypanosoma brucei gambiense DAL972]RHW73198.1 hypothetical protein DPX39_040025000 [Trypanosoma brucei equiperdum]CBH10511.1 hypothetical protein, conserved [Trypanosoma brucei gambiense DAL972]|eukprot:XP_011772800.1 hypothetical protein, conserved [Trypanosoma brucei gambiense DAL972]